MGKFASPPSEVMLEARGVAREPSFKGSALSMKAGRCKVSRLAAMRTLGT